MKIPSPLRGPALAALLTGALFSLCATRGASAPPSRDSIAINPMERLPTADHPNDKEKPAPAKHPDRPDEMPSFQGGTLRDFHAWIARQVRYPHEEAKQNIQGRVIARFTVEPDGSIGNIRIIRAPSDGLARELSRVLALSPRWTPGKKDGKAIPVDMVLPVDFKTNGSKVTKDSPLLTQIEAPEDKISASLPDERNAQQTIDSLDEPPLFRGSHLAEFRQWLCEQIKYPARAQEEWIEGRVTASFIVECDGSVSSIEIVRSPSPLLSKEVVRTLERTPRWTPGRHDGNPIRVKYLVPIDFHIGKSYPNLPEQTPPTEKRTTISSGSNAPRPLYVVDGQIVEGTEPIDPKQVESITVLKGKDATDHYGTLGRNGVVLIQTKKQK